MSIRLAAASLVVVSLVACGGDEAPSAERFCGEILEHRDELTSPDLSYLDDVEPLLDLYRDIGELAPLDIEAEWQQLVLNYETASTVVPGDEESLQRVVATAYESEEAAAAVDRWLNETCGIDLGPLTTLVAHD